jgi:GT2 family glycosyltransferase
MKLSVIIVNYNVRYYIEQCIISVLKAVEPLDAEVFVVDNHSSDGSVKYLRKRFKKRITLIECQHNLGFARANNIAIGQATGEYLLLLNPDTIVGEKTLEQVVRFMDEHPKVGSAGAMMHNSDGTRAPESRRGLPTPMVSLLKMLGFSRRYYMTNLPWDQPGQIEVVSGAFCMLRRETIERVGLLDEDFFMYGEDIDLSYRILQGGYENWYVPAPIVHYKGESTQKSSFRYVHVFYQAMLIFFRKHYDHLALLVSLPIKLAIYFRAFLALVQMLSHRMRMSLGFVNKHHRHQPHYAFVGSHAMLRECRQLAARKGLSADFYSEMPPAELLAGRHVVYDTELLSYDGVIRLASGNLQGLCTLCTYSMRSHVLITPNETIR